MEEHYLEVEAMLALKAKVAMLLELKAMLVVANWVVWLFAKDCELLGTCLTR